MKKLLTVVALMIATYAVQAQKRSDLSFNVGAEVGAATGNLNNFYSFIIGATGQLEYAIDTDAALTLQTGFIQFIGRKIQGTNTKYRSATLIPLLAGVKYDLSPKFFGAAQLGTSINTAKGGGSTFTYSPGIGYKFDDKVEAVLKYTGYSSNNSAGGGTFGIRVSVRL